MYFRSGFQDQEEPYRIPENYSGHAFPEHDPEPETPMTIPPGNEAPISDPPTNPTLQETPHKKETSSTAVPSFLSSLLPPRPHKHHGSLLGDISTEDLLILGLLLLLSTADSDDDIVLLLLLLLFYK